MSHIEPVHEETLPGESMEVKMGTTFINVGFGNMLAMNRVIGVATPKAAPIKLIVEEARNKGLLITLNNGRKSKSVIFLDTGHIALSALEPETIAGRNTN